MNKKLITLIIIVTPIILFLITFINPETMNRLLYLENNFDEDAETE